MGNYAKASFATNVLAVSIACTASGTWAQQALAQAASPKQESGLEEIVVTAQRRSESLLKVPVAVVSLDSSKLEAAGVTMVDDLPKLVPGLQVSSGGGIFFTFIRGVGSSSTSTQGQESGVAQYVDDIYIMDQFGGASAIGDVERVEILKGPQGTLYGRNTTGGLIKFMTPTPQADALMRVKVGYESYETYTGSVYATGGLTDNLLANISLTEHYQADGFGRDAASGQEVNYTRNFGARSKLLWTPTDADRIAFAADFLRDRSDNAVHPTVAPGTTNGYNASLAPPAREVPLPGGRYAGDYNSSTSYGTYPKAEIFGASVTWEHTFDNSLLFKSISAYRHNDVDFGEHYDSDFSGFDLYAGTTEKQMHTFQQEFLVQGTAGPLDYTGGVFFLTSRQHFKVDVSGGAVPFLPLTTPTGILIVAHPSVETYSPYGQVDYHLTDKDTFTAGIRYTRDKQSIYGNRALRLGPVAIRDGGDQSQVYKRPTWRAAYKHEFTDDLMAYVSYSRGFRSGVFNAFNTAADAVSPEEIDAYETGVKAQFLDNRLRVGLTGFYYDYTDLQVARFGPGGVNILENAGAAELYGGELESSASIPVPVGDLQLGASVSLLHPKLTTFQGCTMTTPNPPPGAGGTAVAGDCSDATIPYAPSMQAAVGVSYTLPIARFGGEFGTSVNYYHSSKYYFEPSNIQFQSAYDTVEAEMFYAFPDDKTRLRVYGRNLTDEHVVARLQTTGDVAVQFYKPPRIFGAEIQHTF